MEQLQIKSTKRCELINITDQVAKLVKNADDPVKAVIVYVPHTTAGVLINEAADPAVAADIIEHCTKLVPESESYRHTEGNSDAHIKSVLVGHSVTVPVDKGTMALGTWQGIFFAEFDGPRARKAYVTFLT